MTGEFRLAAICAAVASRQYDENAAIRDIVRMGYAESEAEGFLRAARDLRRDSTVPTRERGN